MRIVLVAAGLAYAFFAAGCFRLAAEHGYERGVSVGEGSFVLLGAVAFFVAAFRPWQAASVALGTLPLVVWFAATPWNSGPPFLVASLIAPCIAAAVLTRTRVASVHASTRGRDVVQEPRIARRSSLSLGILALLLWAVSWSWLVGVGLTLVRVGEIGAVLAGIAAVAVGLTTGKRAANAGLWCGVAALVLVVGLNVLGLVL